MSLTALLKGWFGEAQCSLANKLFLDGEVYVDVNNVTIPTRNGTTQIDHIIVSPYGIFVIETKNISGWIFGDEKSNQWTQSLFGKKYQFQNPLQQNLGHIRALSAFLGIETNKFHSMVMFCSNCEFKTNMPSNVMNHGYIPYIKSKTERFFSPEKVKAIVAAVKNGMLPKSSVTREKHISSLKERFSNTITCPKCGNKLVLRTAKTGTNAGNRFYGCSKFPSCRYTRAEVLND